MIVVVVIFPLLALSVNFEWICPVIGISCLGVDSFLTQVTLPIAMVYFVVPHHKIFQQILHSEIWSDDCVTFYTIYASGIAEDTLTVY